ncbi:ATP-dependent helicase [Paenibacillus sp. CAU 1782]
MKALQTFLDRKKSELGVELNPVQQQAVEATDGPLLLLASPGSGKTTTLIMRIGYLIEGKGAAAERIKAVTFSRAAAQDMKERFRRFFPALPMVDFSTIHSLAFEVAREQLRAEGKGFRIIEGSESGGQSFDANGNPANKAMILRSLFQETAREKLADDQLEELSTFISYIKNKLLPRDKWSTGNCRVPHAETVALLYEEYKNRNPREPMLDFDDMLTIANDALEHNAEMLRRYQRRYDYVLTDESQDTSLVQHRIIEKLARGHRNLCVVADDDQSIYSWRGAEPAYLLHFRDVYPDALILYMEQNYRSSRSIVSPANAFIKRNLNRYPKEMFTQNSDGDPIVFKQLASYRKQAKYLAKELQKETKLSEAAVLFRNQSSSIMLMNELDRAGIPFYMKDADNRFFSHWVVEDVLNFMRMSYTDKRPDLLERIHLKFKGYISKHQMAVLKEINNNESVFDNLVRFVTLKDYQEKLLMECKDTFKEINEMPPLHAIRVIRDRLGYEKALEGMCERLGFRKDYLIGILNSLEDIAEGLETLADFAARLSYLEQLLKTAKGRRGQNAVTLSTFHSSKGLEFDKVYMVDLIDGIIPGAEDGKRGPDGSQPLMEEAVRLFYVGMTRARHHLELIAYSSKDGERTAPSPFMEAVRTIVEPERVSAGMQFGTDRHGGKRGLVGASALSDAASPKGVKYASAAARAAEAEDGVAPVNPDAITVRSGLIAGAGVRHRVFGRGVIEEIGEDSIHIRFGDKPVKSLSIAMCLDKGLLEPMDDDSDSIESEQQQG